MEAIGRGGERRRFGPSHRSTDWAHSLRRGGRVSVRGFCAPGTLEQGRSGIPGTPRAARVESDDRTKIVVSVDEYSYELLDADDASVASVGTSYQGLPELAEVRRVTYRAADGLEIPA